MRFLDAKEHEIRNAFSGIVDVKMVRRVLTDIDAIKSDDGDAHQMADGLHQSLLLAIAEGRCLDPVECCKLAMETDLIPFTRWYE